jgi:co-chaperonin GroES (HSP10)
MKLKPLTGQVLVEILPPEKVSVGGILFPDELPLSAETVQAGHRHPTPPKPWIGVVREVGPWPKTKSGLMRMPEYGRGAQVVIKHHAGQEMRRGIGQNYRMVQQAEVLAVIQAEITP